MIDQTSTTQSLTKTMSRHILSTPLPKQQTTVEAVGGPS
jgi:hypothetical protein